MSERPGESRRKPEGRTAPPSGAIAPRAVVDGVARWASQLEAALDPRRAAGDLLGLLVGSVDATRGSLMLVNTRSGRLHLVAGLSLPEGILGQDLPPAPRRISDWVMRERKAMVMNGEVRDARFEASAAHDRISSAICVPLPGANGVAGVLNLARTGLAPAFTPAELAAIEAVTPAVTAILERIVELGNARPLWQQLARRPAPPAWPAPRAREIAFARLEGLAPGPLVSEHYMHADGTFAVLLAEPLGSAARSLRVGEWLRGMFHAAGARVTEPAAFASELHQQMLAHQPGGGARAWLGAIGPSGSLRSCAAGFPAPFCLPGEGEPGERLSEGGPALGAVTGSPPYEEATLRLLPGDAVVVVNEGVLRSRSGAAVRFGEAGVLEQLLDHRRRPLDGLVEALAAAARSHAGLGATPDDAVVFAIRFKRED
ncbi:MAG TPA: SpoIIE family protein phosphatase [Candidatus Eisenbacteria bacterium]